MYVTRPLSLYRKHPSAVSMEPPEGPYTGYLVITDEEAEAQGTKCWGTCKNRRIKKLPFPHDKILSVVYSPSEFHQENSTVVKKAWFLPVLDLPLSSNCYYIIKAKGRHKGQAYTCSREMDMSLCCFNSVIRDTKPKPFDHSHRNIYQQFKIHRHHGHTFFSKSMSPDGFPPKFLRRKGWKARASRSYKYQFTEALGLDESTRARLPSLDFPMSSKTSESVIVGKWWCPFLFIREEMRLKQQMKWSMLYGITLEQCWEEIYSCNNEGNNNNSTVNVKANVKREVYEVFGMEGLKDGFKSHGGFIWYRAWRGSRRGVGFKVGLSFAVVEKMKWVQEAGGWVEGPETNVAVEQVVQITSENGWRRFSCYALVESFVLRRLDGSLVLKCNFRHTDKFKCRCE